MCGFSQSILATVPETVTGRLPSYSAANEWCAASEAAQRRRPQATGTAALMIRPSWRRTCGRIVRPGYGRWKTRETSVEILADEELVDGSCAGRDVGGGPGPGAFASVGDVRASSTAARDTDFTPLHVSTSGAPVFNQRGPAPISCFEAACDVSCANIPVERNQAPDFADDLGRGRSGRHRRNGLPGGVDGQGGRSAVCGRRPRQGY